MPENEPAEESARRAPERREKEQRFFADAERPLPLRERLVPPEKAEGGKRRQEEDAEIDQAQDPVIHLPPLF